MDPGHLIVHRDIELHVVDSRLLECNLLRFGAIVVRACLAAFVLVLVQPVRDFEEFQTFDALVIKSVRVEESLGFGSKFPEMRIRFFSPL